MPSGNSALMICNEALALVGVRVGYMETMGDNHREAQLCRLFYDVARQIVLRSFPFHQHVWTLTLSGKTAQAGLPESVPYLYRYDYPASLAVDPDTVPASEDEATGTVLRVVEMTRGGQIAHIYKSPHFRHIGNYIYTNEDDASVRVIVDDPTPGGDKQYIRSTVLIRRAIATKLACLIALPITGNPELLQGLMQQYAAALTDAMTNAGNRGNTVQAPPESEYITERLGG